MSRRLASTIGAVALAAGLSAAPATASAASPSAEMLGSTRVAVAPVLYKFLGKADIAPATIGKAKAKAFRSTIAVIFPISDMAKGGDRIKHAGGASLSNGHERIALKRFWIDLDRGRVSAAVNGSIGDVGRVDVLRLAESKRPGLGDVRLVMTRTAAGALNATFDVKRFSKGDNFGFAKVRLSS